jgi:hypothetical protein
MLVAIDINETVEYSSTMDTKEPRTVFLLGAIPAVVMASLKDQSRVVLVDITNNDGRTPVRTNVGEMQLNYVRYGLKGWTNFKNRKGETVPFRTQKQSLSGREVEVASDESLNYLSDEIVQELADKLRDFNSLSVEEVKNSE